MNVKQLEFTDDAKQKSAEYKIKYRNYLFIIRQFKENIKKIYHY